MDDIVVVTCRKGSRLTNFKNKFLKSTAYLPEYVEVIYAVGQDLFVITRIVILIPCKILSWLIA
jgi:hypothetical protein